MTLGWIAPHLRRAASAPVLVTAVLAMTAAAAPVLRENWMAWILLGLASGYALSGST